MIANFGFGVLVITFLVTVYSVFAAIYGDRKQIPAMVESARRAMLLTWPLLSLTAGVLIYLLVNNHFEVQFVYEVTSRSMPTYLKVTAWWGGQAGSLLFWSWLMSAFASLVTLRKWDRDREFLPWVIVVACITMAFFSASSCWCAPTVRARRRSWIKQRTGRHVTWSTTSRRNLPMRISLGWERRRRRPAGTACG